MGLLMQIARPDALNVCYATRPLKIGTECLSHLPQEEEVAQLIAEARREMRAVVERLQKQAASGDSAAKDGDVDPYEAGTRVQDIADAYSPDRQQVGHPSSCNLW